MKCGLEVSIYSKTFHVYIKFVVGNIKYFEIKKMSLLLRRLSTFSSRCSRILTSLPTVSRRYVYVEQGPSGDTSGHKGDKFMDGPTTNLTDVSQLPQETSYADDRVEDLRNIHRNDEIIAYENAERARRIKGIHPHTSTFHIHPILCKIEK